MPAIRPGVSRTGSPRTWRTKSSLGRPFKLDPDCALFVLREKGFYVPADWQFDLIQDPQLWFNATMLALWAALKPFVPTA